MKRCTSIFCTFGHIKFNELIIVIILWEQTITSNYCEKCEMGEADGNGNGEVRNNSEKDYLQ